MQNKNSGQALIFLLIAVMIVALLSVFVMNKLLSKKSDALKRENEVEYEVPTVENSKGQIDETRQKINDIQNEYNKKIEDQLK